MSGLDGIALEKRLGAQGAGGANPHAPTPTPTSLRDGKHATSNLGSWERQAGDEVHTFPRKVLRVSRAGGAPVQVPVM